ALGGAAFYKWYNSGPKPGAPETLGGVSIGQPQSEVKSALNLSTFREMNPWSRKPPGMSLGHVLKPADLGLADDAMNEIDVGWTDDKQVVALFHEGKLKALILHEPHKGLTGRGGQIGQTHGDFLTRYPEAEHVSIDSVEATKAKLEVRRDDALGI